MSLTLPFARWPETDQQMWAALVQQGGPFDERGALADLRETSLDTLGNRYGRWLQWLRDCAPEALAEPPAQRASLIRLRGWLAALEHTAPMSQLMFVDGLLRVLTAAAPDADWSAHRRVKASLKRAAGSGDPTRKQGRILCTRVLLEAGLRHARLEADAATTPLMRARRQRNGAMVALLAMMPIRRRALAGLRIGRSFLVGAETLTIALPGDLTKTGLPWEADVPEPVAGLLRQYMTETRPFLLDRGGQRHDILWVGDDGRPFDENHLGMKIAGITKELTGKRIPPHMFRDAAATTLARTSPEAARFVRPVLAHAGFGTAERHYVHARTIEAGRDYAAVIKTLRAKR